MRYRALDANGDYSFGQGGANFLVNTPACVAQLVQTRLRLFEGEWFLDQTEGTPWFQEVLGKNAKAVYDLAIRSRILGTQGVASISEYSSELSGRELFVTASIVTIYDSAPVVVATAVTPPPPVSGHSLDFSQDDNDVYIPALIH